MRTTATSRPAPAAPPRRRRTQEERSAATREKVIQAAIACIVEEGLPNTTAARLAARSGVTWGAIAHQFGDKDSVLFAVVEHNAEMYRALLDEALRRTGHTLEERVAALIDVTWRYTNEPSAVAFTELVLYDRTNRDARIAQRQEDLANRQTKPVWDEFFGEFGIAPARLEVARNLALATIQGLLVMRLLARERPMFRKEVAALKRVVVQLLRA